MTEKSKREKGKTTKPGITITTTEQWGKKKLTLPMTDRPTDKFILLAFG